MRITITGAAGRMGQALMRAAAATPDLNLVAALEHAGSPAIGRDIGEMAGLGPLGVTVSDDTLSAFAASDAVIDFTQPSTAAWHAELAAQARIVLVVGTTGLGPDEERALTLAARHARIVRSGNMSRGINLLSELVRQAARALSSEFDIEIVEMHHRHKVDAPSGTALMLGEAAADGRGVDLAAHAARGRDGLTGARDEGDIGFASLRGGSVVGDHSAIFAGPSERLVLSHHAEDRAIFANGALAAVRWAFDRKPGLYTMRDVLGLNGHTRPGQTE